MWNLDFTEARDSEWQWHQLGHMQICTLLQTNNHASNPPLSFFTGWMPFLPPNQQRQSTEGKQPYSNRSISPTVRPTAANPLRAGTWDRRTRYHLTEPASHTMWAMPLTKVQGRQVTTTEMAEHGCKD